MKMNNTDELYKELLVSEYNELGKQIINLENKLNVYYSTYQVIDNEIIIKA